MSLYNTIGVLAFFAMLLVPSKQRLVSNGAGTIILAIVWPTLLVGLAYWGPKKLLTGRGVSARYGELETHGVLVVGCVATFLVLFLTRPR